MLKLLLDEPISPDVGKGLLRLNKNIQVESLIHWKQGKLLGLPDSVILQEAAEQNLTFVTFDCRTIPPLLKAWAGAGRDHCGVIFIAEKTIAPSDFGGLIRAIEELCTKFAHEEWRNRVSFLRRPR